MSALELGWPSDGHINIKSAVLEKSKQTDFYAQDDWEVTPRLTLSLGLRYEWSVPYTERYNRIQFSNFAGNSGITVNLAPPTSGITDDNGNPVNLSSLGLGPTQLPGTTVFPSSRRAACFHRPQQFWAAARLRVSGCKEHGPPWRRWALLWAFVPATNFQMRGRHSGSQRPSTSRGRWRNPCPGLGNEQCVSQLPPNTLPQPQGTKYGALAEWGFGNDNDLGTLPDHNPEIYQWNLGVQHLFPAGIVISADYSANRSTHLPWGGATRNRDTLPTAARNPRDSTCQSSLVPNPFQGMFTGPNAVFNEPDSIYNNPTIPEGNLLRRFPQFDGFEGLPLIAASSWFNGLLVRFQKRASQRLQL